MPRLLLISEEQGHGGVATVRDALAALLTERGWIVTQVGVRGRDATPWRQLWQLVRECDVIVASNNFRPAYVALGLALGGRRPVVVWVHGPLHAVLTHAHASGFKRWLQRWVQRSADRLVFVSRASRDGWVTALGGRAPDPAVVIHNAVPSGSLASLPAAAEASAQAPVRLGYVGRLSSEKRPELLLVMLRLLPAYFHLTVVGDGPLRATLMAQGQDLISAGRLLLVGAQHVTPSTYQAWSATLITSAYEGCPMVLLESAAAGVPCVCVPLPAVEELLQPDASHWIAAEATPQALAEAVQSLLLMSPTERQAQALAVAARHPMSAFADAWDKVLRDVLREEPA